MSFPIEIIGYIGMIIVLFSWAIVRRKPTLSFLVSLFANVILFCYSYLMNQPSMMILNTASFIVSLHHFIRSRQKNE